MFKNSTSEKAMSNSASVLCYTIINVILIACYFIEVVKGSRTIGYFTVFCLLALIPMVLTYLKNKKSTA